jgi:hypothetical protein
LIAPSLTRVNYAPTATGVYFSQPTTIHYLEFASRKIITVYTMSKPADLGFSLSPDHRYLLFAQNDFSGSDLMLVENFK